MGKFANYVIMMSGLIILFYFSGLLDNTASTILLDFLLDPQSFQDSPLALKTTTAILGILASAVVVGFALAGNVELGVMVAFTTFIFSTLWDFISVFLVLNATNPVFAILIFSPVLFLFVVTILEWWRGVST